MSNWLNDYEGVWARFEKFKVDHPDYRHKSHILAESLAANCDVFIIKTELYRTWNDPEPFATGLSSEPKSKQYAIEQCETGSLGRALVMAGYPAKAVTSNWSHQKPIETTKPELAEFVKEQRPNDPDPIVWDVSQMVQELGAEVIDEIPLCSGGDGPMILKQGTKEGKEYRGWVCSTPKSGHPAKWMKIGADGSWYFPR
jgi:hypothetical protein